MARVVITAKVADAAKWEEAFRTHGGLLGTMAQSRTYFSTNKDNDIVLYSEPSDLDKFMKVLDSAETVEAMTTDGVDRDTVKVFVLDEVFVY
jgi:hypothetical protein